MQNFYTIRNGDTIEKLSAEWGIPVDTIASASNINPPYKLYEGDQLSVPSGIFKNAVPYYVTRRGDNLFRIAMKYNFINKGIVLIDLLRRINGITYDDLPSGYKLKIPYAPIGGLGKIAYCAYKNGIYSIYVYNTDTGVSKQMPYTEGIVEERSELFWSPDGKAIAFIGRQKLLFVIFLDGSISMLDKVEFGTPISWSQDGFRISYCNENKIIIRDLRNDNGLVLDTENACAIQWMPGSSELIYSGKDSKGKKQLYKITDDGKTKKRLTYVSNMDFNNIKLSPDGRHVLYTNNDDNSSLINSMEIESGNNYEFYGGSMKSCHNPIWNPAVPKVAYSSTEALDKISYSKINICDYKGQDIKGIASSDSLVTPICWNQKGDKIAYLSGYSSERGVATELWAVDINHPAPSCLVKADKITAIAWSKA